MKAKFTSLVGPPQCGVHLRVERGRRVAASLALLLLIMGLAAPFARAATYLVTNSPGWNLLANQLDSPNGNNIRNVFPSPTTPVGSTVQKFSLATKSFQTIETFTAAGGWSPGTNILNTGEGFYFFNNSAGNFTATFSGNLHSPTGLPLNLGPGMVLIGRQTNDIATVTNILGFNPSPGTIVYRFNAAAGNDPHIFNAANYTIHALKSSGWTTPPGPPNAIRVGESVWLTTNGSPPAIVVQPQSQVVCSNSPNASATFSVVAVGTAPLTYQWFLNNNPISGATSNVYTISPVSAANLGTYFVQVSNPLGTTPSGNATLAYGDTTPPTMQCPQRLLAACAGPNGTSVNYSPSAFDNCDGNVPVNCDPPSGSLFPVGDTSVACSATDSHGNNGNCTFTVSITDTNPPSVKCPQDQTTYASGAGTGAQVFFTVTATDNCDPNPSVTCTPSSGSTFPIGTTSVSCTASDSAQNKSTCRFNVVVRDPPCCDAKDWNNLVVTGNSPGQRKNHAMAYDFGRHRLVLFGGTDAGGTIHNDTWEYDGTQWFLVFAGGATEPHPRESAAMAYDSVRGRTVLFGGRDLGGMGGASNDTWEWDGTTWHFAGIPGAIAPPARYQHAMAFDPTRGKVVLFGGSGSDTSAYGDTWEYDASGWVPITTAGPPPRLGHAMVFREANRRIFLYGGAADPSGANFFDDSWQWDGKTWQQVAAGSPPKRKAHAMYYDAFCDKVFLFGGTASVPFGDTWQWDGNAWTQLIPSNSPPRRSGHAMAFDRDNARGLMYGGVSGNQLYGDLWELRQGQTQTPLTIISAEANCGENKLTITFSRGLTASSALNPANYSINCGGVSLQVSQVVFGPDNHTVCVFVSGSFAIGSGCFVVVHNIRDVCGNLLEQSSYPFACDPCASGSGGRDFWVTFPGNYAPDPTNRPTVKLFITGNPGVTGQVSAPGLTPPFLANFTIPGSREVTVNLPSDAELGDDNDVVSPKGVHVTAAGKVSVYGLNHMPQTSEFSSDAYMALPTNILGRAYLIMSYQNVFNGIPELDGNEFAIVACEDDTKIGILPKANAAVHPAGVPFFIALHKGETYQLRCTNDAPNDLTGSIVVGDKPIAVFGAHRCANIPSTNVFFCDHIVEQLPPTTLWGTDFITQRLATRKSDTFRIMAVQNSTTVRTNGTIVGGGSIGLGGFVEIELYAAVHITADKPVLVAEFANSSDYDMVTASDPFMVLVPPTTMYGSDYTIQAPTDMTTPPNPDFADNYINVVVPTANVGTIFLDGGAIPVASFGVVPGTAYSTAAVHVATGPHRINSSGQTPFGAIVYGWGPQYDSYGYPAGFCTSKEQRPPPPIQCPTNFIAANLGTNCSLPLPDLRNSVNGDRLIVTQDPAPGTQVGVGPTHITLVASDIYGGSTTCIVDFVVSGGVNIFCPSRVETNCVNGAATVVNFTVGTCDPNLQANCSPPSGSTFPIGTTTVSCVVNDPKLGGAQCSFPVRVRCPTLTISQSGNTVTVTYTGGTLQATPDLRTGQWTPVNANGTYMVTPAPRSQQFFRLIPDP